MIKTILIILLFNLTVLPQNIDIFLSSIESESPETQLELLTKETWQYRSKNPTYAIKCGNLAIEIATELNNQSKLAQVNNYLGVIYRNIGNYTKSLVYYNHALDISRSIQDSIQIAYSYNNIGGAYRLERNYTLALTNMYRALEIFESLDNEEGIGFCAINIGIVYKLQGNFDKASDYFTRSLNIREQLGDNFGKAITLNQIVEISYDSGDFETALERYKELLKIYEDLNDSKGIAVVFGGIGGIKFHQKNYQEAKSFREMALDINRKIQNTEGIINNLNELSLIYLKLGEYSKASNAISEAKKVSRESEHAVFLINYFKYQSLYFEELEKYDSALAYHKKFTVIKDSLAAAENMNAIALMESVYQVDLTSKENRLLQNENKLRNEQALFLLVLAIILIAFISFVLFKYFQNKNINTELKELNATKDKFFSIVAHDLKNPFSNLLGFSELLVSDYDNMSEAERKQAVSDLNASSKKLVALVENLLQWARANIGSLQYKPTNLNLLLFFKDLETVFHGSLKQKSLSVKFEIDANISALVDVDYLNLVMRNLFSNAIKFSYPNSTITLRAIDHIDDIHIEVSDNGVGIDENKQKMLFTLGENISTTGTRNEKGTGLGLILVKDLVTKWGGEIRVTSEVKKGSTFLVTIPKTKVSS